MNYQNTSYPKKGKSLRALEVIHMKLSNPYTRGKMMTII